MPCVAGLASLAIVAALAEIETCRAVRPFTMTSHERIVGLVRAVEYVCDVGVPGDVVECGVWQGGSSMAIALTLIARGDTSRTLYLFDTYEGMSPPDEVDRTFAGVAAEKLMKTQKRETSDVWAVAPLEAVQRNLTSTGYPADRLRFVRGRVEETVPDQAPDQIAVLRLDTDWYESTRHELEHLFPRLSTRGVLIIDDYGHWQGARRAVDEYIATHRVPILLNRLDYTGRIAVKVD